MSTPSFILALDHGTTSIRACLMDREGRIVSTGQQPVEQIYPRPDWVEHDANQLWHATLVVCEKALAEHGATWRDVAAIGLTNQRETVVLWDRESGKPVANAIVWQCRRTSPACAQLRKEGHAAMIQVKTGLVIDPYFSATKLQWLLREHSSAAIKAMQGKLAFGTVDTWISWNLSGRQLHVTDVTNASRTMLFNIHTRQWDDELLALFEVPGSLLPEVHPSQGVLGNTDPAVTDGVAVPIAALCGDQQAALFGQKCWQPGLAKSTYGTGAFLMMTTGREPVQSRRGLLTTLAPGLNGLPVYAMEGAVFIAGAALEWLQHKLHCFDDISQVDALATSIADNRGVYFVPAFTGLGAPYWDAAARGVLCGLTQDTGKAHLVRAALEAMVFQTKEVLDVMEAESGVRLACLRVDGGVTRSRFLMQMMANVLNIPVARSADAELTAKGAGYLAGLAVGFWKNADALAALPEQWETFEPDPTFTETERQRLLGEWQAAVKLALTRPELVQSLVS
ncbi:MAG: glycerol kinase GlpK [Candidatus Melainabacteria bacterium]